MRVDSTGVTFSSVVLSIRSTLPVLVVHAAFLLAACERPQDVPAVAHDDTTVVETESPAERHFSCGDQLSFSVRLEADTAVVRLPETELRLPQQETASGVRFAADGYELHTKGGEAVFTTPDASYRDCRERAEQSVWEDARSRGVTFRAIGQEPGWVLEVRGDDHLELMTNYGDDVYESGTMRRKQRSDGFSLHGMTSSGEVHISVRHEECTDLMSGERFASRVTVAVAGEELHGCGRRLK
jgi:putative lipoprotein